MKKILFIILTTLSHQLNAQIEISSNCELDIATVQKNHLNKDESVYKNLRIKYPINKIGGIEYLSFIAKVNSDFNRENTSSDGVLVGTQIGDILSFKYPINQLQNINSMNGIEILKVAGMIKPTLDRARYDTRVDSVHLGYNLPQAFTGKDVLIGITDWGFDYSSPMFYDTLLQNSRILAAWDQFKTSGPAPSGYNYGTEFDTPTELATAYADTANVYSYATHGSHVAGITGGSGAGTQYRGMAFEAQFLFVTFLVDESAVLDAWQWMYDKAQAEGKRLVINMSWGLYYMGDLDGTALISQAIDNYSDLGVTFVSSAGNNGNPNFHLQHNFATDTMQTYIQFYTGGANGQWGQSIHGWGEVGTNFEASIRILNSSNAVVIDSPWYATDIQTAYLDTFLVVAVGDTLFYNLSMDEVYPTNSRPQMRLRIKIPPAGFKVVFRANSVNSDVHFWNMTELTTDVGNWGMPFTSLGSGYEGGDSNYGIGQPACTESLITVAAHTPSYLQTNGIESGGAIANFSSYGPIIDGTMKPDISAPGVNIGSSISSITDNAYNQITSVNFNGNDYPFAKFSGTSMSSPCVAGIVALMLEANPYLSPWQVKEIIRKTARTDSYTGVLPPEGDVRWGHGKINAIAAIWESINTVGIIEVPKQLDWTVYPNPTSALIQLKGLGQIDIKTIQIIDINGRVITVLGPNDPINVSGLSKGTYILRILLEDSVEQQKFVVR